MWVLHQIYFPVSGIKTYIFLPPLIMFFISSIVSPAGVSGAFILLPLQLSLFGYTSCGVSGTNFIYNIVSIPLGSYQYIKEKKLSWTLLLLFILGTVPGIFLGYVIRIKYLPNPFYFKVFVGMVLFYLGIRCLMDSFSSSKGEKRNSIKIIKEKIGFSTCSIITPKSTIKYNTFAVFFPSLLTGVIGGAYGIGGGAIMAPYSVSILKLPVYIVGGATLISTWFSSIIAALFYAFGPFSNNSATIPDFSLGLLFGLGGMAGIYVGTKLQKRLPASTIKLILGIAIFFISLKYIATPFFN